MKNTLLLFALVVCSIGYNVSAQIQVSLNRKFLSTRDGKPFFWLGDTDWELFHRLTREEAEVFLESRRRQGFNVIQAVALAEFNGLHGANRYGDLPLINDDPTRLAITPGNNPNDAIEYDYWDHVEFVIAKAAEKGLYIGLLPTWGDKVAHLWGDGPIIFNADNAKQYGAALAKRYREHWNVIWILGGDRPAVYSSKQGGIEKSYDDRPVWTAMARGIEEVIGDEVFITYHPWGAASSSSQYLQGEKWLDMNAFQSSHGSLEVPAWEWVARDLALKPQKPTLDMEPCYEDHPINPWDGKWTRQRGYFTAGDVRARIYRTVFAGACGVTYGHHQVWQFLNKEMYEPVNVGDTLIGWQKALNAEAGNQMQFLKYLMLSRPYFDRVPDQSLVKTAGSTYLDLVSATRAEDRSYAMVYLPDSKPVTIDLDKISGKTKKIWWFDPRSGTAVLVGTDQRTGEQMFTPPNGKDWVLVIDDESKGYGPLGRRSR